MTNTVHNLDEQSEYFEFILGGNKYTFRYPTTEEIADMKKLMESENVDEQAQIDWFLQFVEGNPKLADVFPKITIKQQQNFLKMVMAEFTGDAPKQ